MEEIIYLLSTYIQMEKNIEVIGNVDRTDAKKYLDHQY
jgi:hypothetical protein